MYHNNGVMGEEYYVDDEHTVELDNMVHVVPVESPHSKAHNGLDDDGDNEGDSDVDHHGPVWGVVVHSKV